ncbi:MAG: Na/Pi cotransporter family protein [Erysipelotrichaceae bacterium]|nr:Na/Pi cotransporter family protein [Erysipelotrichaceae bacterium]
MHLSDISWDLFLCGLGLFLFGVVLMGGGLKSLAGNRLKDLISKYTSKPLQGILVGAGLTALVQSSSATTAIVIGFIRAGLMNLHQAAGVIIGANIGSTVTSFLLSLNISGLAPYMIVVGAFVLLLSKDKKANDIGSILVGLGMLFYGIDLIGDTLSHLSEVKEFTSLANLCANNPFVGLAIGLIMTVAMQASSAAIGVIQVIFETGAISLAAVIPFLFGSNIGTCITAIMTSIGGNPASKQAAVLHTTFNVIGTTIGMLCLTPLTKFVTALNINPMMQISVTHIIFNVATTILVFPFINHLCKFAELVIKEDKSKKKNIDLSNLDPTLFPVASAALTVAYKYIIQEKDLVLENCQLVEKDLLNPEKDDDLVEEITSNEEIINKIDKSLTKFLTDIKTDTLSDDTNKLQIIYLDINKNLERIGDMAINILDMSKMIKEDKGDFTPAAVEEISSMFNTLYEMTEIAFKYVDTKSMDDYGELVVKEDHMDLLEEQSRSNHFERMKRRECKSPVASSLYVDIVYNLERMADHSYNIAKTVFNKQ